MCLTTPMTPPYQRHPLRWKQGHTRLAKVALARYDDVGFYTEPSFSFGARGSLLSVVIYNDRGFTADET